MLVSFTNTYIFHYKVHKQKVLLYSVKDNLKAVVGALSAKKSDGQAALEENMLILLMLKPFFLT